ncbi:MAG: CoB--CoM heterodisulfide reductase iron-sulfur subunit B family protein [Candidatus Altiarchaeota archaeon]
MKRKYLLFLGCTTPARGLNYEQSARIVAEKLGIEFIDESRFACCGFTVRPLNEQAAMAMAARNLAIAEEKGLDICTLCTGCASFPAEVNRLMKTNQEQKNKINELLAEIGLHYNGSVKVSHITRILHEDIGCAEIKKHVVEPLTGVKIAAHYGCHMTKPSEAFSNYDSVEYPHVLDDLTSATGAIPIEYQTKKDCCGGNIYAINEDLAYTMANKKLSELTTIGADAITLACTFCDIMYEHNQRKIAQKFDSQYNIPVLYLPQLLGLSFGISPQDLGMQLNRVRTQPLLDKIKGVSK